MDVQKTGRMPDRMNVAETRDSGAIVARARAGDAEAWGDLYREYAPAIFRFCRRALPTREDAEDATMEVFMKIRDKLDQYDTTRPFTAWLYRVAANHCWDMLRRRKIRQDKETDDLETLPLEHPDPNQLDQLIEKRTSEEVRKALDKLGARARMALVLRYYSDMSYDEIAAARAARIAPSARRHGRHGGGRCAMSSPPASPKSVEHLDEMTCMLYLEGQL